MFIYTQRGWLILESSTKFLNQTTFKNLHFCRWFLCFLLLCTACPWLLPEEKQRAFLLANFAHLFLKCIVTVYATQNKQRTVYTLRIIYLRCDVFRFIKDFQFYIYSMSCGPYWLYCLTRLPQFVQCPPLWLTLVIN